MNNHLETPTSVNELTTDYFQERLAEAMVIDDQNQRYDVAQTDTTFDGDLEDFRQLALSGIQAEQAETLDTLRERDNLPYELISKEYEDRVKELAAAEARDAELSNLDEAQQRRLREAARRAIELAPLVETAAQQLVSARIRNLATLDHGELQAKITQLQAEIADLAELHSLAGTPWPVPRATSGNDPSMLIEDIIPLGPDTHASPENETLCRLFERHGYTHGASIMLTAYLLGNPGVIFTPEQLGQELYVDDSHFEGMTEEKRLETMRLRIHNLLNSRAKVAGFLQDEGFRLQYGWRYFLNPRTRKNLVPKRRIYRAVPLETGIDPGDTFPDDIVMVAEDGTQYREAPVPMPQPTRSTVSEERRNELMRTDDEPDPLQELPVKQLIAAMWDKGLLPKSVDGFATPKKLKVP
ncbi:MAG TPA: hypothetical protein VFH39_00700, partial [Candidatus Saccharimonadales bacterium]|nr:hypothetical protein [Candidatus Saccharimonadales bacterium]